VITWASSIPGRFPATDSLAQRTSRGRADHRLHPLPWTLPVPLRVHGRYSRAEIEAAFGVLTADAPWIHREGVLWHQPSATDLLFITLRLPGRRPACRRH
jgi:hypothetical protein